MLQELNTLLDTAEADAIQAAEQSAHLLNDEDHRMLVLAFHRAETLAEYALLEAHSQVPAVKQLELEEQIEDERRHIAVFADWLESPPAIPVPKSRRRPEVVWYSVLLVNEIAGYCQFHMLAGLLTDHRHKNAVEQIAKDERVHIARLVRWLRDFAGTTTWGSVTQVTDAFRRRLDMRMQQFLPREELGPVRAEMGRLIDRLIVDALSTAETSAKAQ